MDHELMMFEQDQIGRHLKQARVRRGFSTSDVASYLGVSSGMYESFEKGLRSVPAEYVRTLCAYLRISADDLFGVSRDIQR